jgi:hypothetical protein
VRSSRGFGEDIVTDDDIATPHQPTECPSEVSGIACGNHDSAGTSSPKPRHRLAAVHGDRNLVERDRAARGAENTEERDHHATTTAAHGWRASACARTFARSSGASENAATSDMGERVVGRTLQSEA